MSALDEYDRVWDMFLETHRQTHGENHVPTRDFNCCGEYAVLMALRAASSLKPEYPERLLLRMAAMPELDRDFYVKNLLSTDGEPDPSVPAPGCGSRSREWPNPRRPRSRKRNAASRSGSKRPRVRATSRRTRSRRTRRTPRHLTSRSKSPCCSMRSPSTRSTSCAKS